MMGAAKFLVATVGGGLLLGTIGGHFANPVMQQRGGDEPWREMLRPDIPAASEQRTARAPQSGDLRPYGGNYSFPPPLMDETVQVWSPSDIDAEWLEYGPAWPEPPTIADLEAWESSAPEAQALGRTESLPPASSIENAAAQAERVAEEVRAAAEVAPTEELPPEPRVARGELPAIW